MRYPVGRSNQEFQEKWYNAQSFGKKTSYGYHEGDDFNLKSGGNTDLGQTLYAIAEGEVSSVHDHATGFGKHIHIYHPQLNVWSHYAHCQSIKVKVGDTVHEGEVIGTLGSTGNSEYAHLHFAIKNQPTGVDGIAKTQADLAKWENPTLFMAKHVVGTQESMTDTIAVKKTDFETLVTKATKLDSLEAKGITLESFTLLQTERDAGNTRVGELTRKYDSFIQWVVDKLKPMNVLPPLVDEALAKQYIEEMISKESSLQTELKRKEKEWHEERKELLQEQKDLLERITQLDDALLQSQGTIANLSEELEDLKKDVLEHKEHVDEVREVKTFLDSIKALFERWRK